MPSHAATQVRRAPKARPGAVVETAARSTTQHQAALSQRHRTTEQALACKALCSQVSDLLYAAADADQDCDRSGNAQRLLGIAGSSADLAAACEWRKPNPEDPIYDVAALMSAASRVTGDVMGSARGELLSQAWDLLLQLTESDRREDIDDSYFSSQPNATACSGLNAVQLGMALEVIAGEAGTLCDLLNISELGEASAKRTAFAAARIVAEGIGAKADSASGAGIRGDADTWHYGAAFSTAGIAQGAA